MPERQLDPPLSQWMVQTLARITATYAICQGFFIILGGPDRWHSPSLATAMSVPGAPATWGVVLCALGITALAGSFRPQLRLVAWSLFGIGAWSFFFAVSLSVTFVQVPNTSTTGLNIYSYAGAVACVLGVGYRRSRA